MSIMLSDGARLLPRKTTYAGEILMDCAAVYAKIVRLKLSRSVYVTFTRVINDVKESTGVVAKNGATVGCTDKVGNSVGLKVGQIHSVGAEVGTEGKEVGIIEGNKVGVREGFTEG